MCPADTEWYHQSVGANGNPNMHYGTFKAYAPINAVSFKEGMGDAVEDKMLTFNDTAAGIDEYGRKYSVVWLALASYDETTGEWTYFGKNSTEQRYIGWTYNVEWYDENGIKIDTDAIRINLSNEDCHNILVGYEMAQYQKIDDPISIDRLINGDDPLIFDGGLIEE